MSDAFRIAKNPAGWESFLVGGREHQTDVRSRRSPQRGHGVCPCHSGTCQAWWGQRVPAFLPCPSRGCEGQGCLLESRGVNAEPAACCGTPGPEVSVGCSRFLAVRALGLLLPLPLFCGCSYRFHFSESDLVMAAQIKGNGGRAACLTSYTATAGSTWHCHEK